MMRALYHLRRSVALFICPEMGVQAAPQGGTESLLPDDQGERWEQIMFSAFESPDVFDELKRLVTSLRFENRRRSGDDRLLGLQLCSLIATMALPVGGLK